MQYSIVIIHDDPEYTSNLWPIVKKWQEMKEAPAEIIVWDNTGVLNPWVDRTKTIKFVRAYAPFKAARTAAQILASFQVLHTTTSEDLP